MGQRGAWTAEVSFDGVRVPDGRLVGDGGPRLPQRDDRARPRPAAHRGHVRRHRAAGPGRVGRARRDSRQGGVPIGDYQLVQAMLAESYAEIAAGRSLVLSVAAAYDEGRDRAAGPSSAKLFCAEMVSRVADRGGAGPRRARLHELDRRRADVPRLAAVPPVRGDERDPEAHHRPGAARGRPPVTADCVVRRAGVVSVLDSADDLDFSRYLRAGRRPLVGPGLRRAAHAGRAPARPPGRGAVPGLSAFIGLPGADRHLRAARPAHPAHLLYRRGRQRGPARGGRPRHPARALLLVPRASSGAAPSAPTWCWCSCRRPTPPAGTAWASPGTTWWPALGRARVIIGEVSPLVPWTTGGPTLAAADLAASSRRAYPPAEVASAPPTAVQRAIAASVAGLIEDGATLQFGIGALPAAVLSELSGRRHLGVHSGLLPGPAGGPDGAGRGHGRAQVPRPRARRRGHAARQPPPVRLRRPQRAHRAARHRLHPRR